MKCPLAYTTNGNAPDVVLTCGHGTSMVRTAIGDGKLDRHTSIEPWFASPPPRHLAVGSNANDSPVDAGDHHVERLTSIVRYDLETLPQAVAGYAVFERCPAVRLPHSGTFEPEQTPFDAAQRLRTREGFAASLVITHRHVTASPLMFGLRQIEWPFPKQNAAQGSNSAERIAA